MLSRTALLMTTVWLLGCLGLTNCAGKPGPVQVQDPEETGAGGGGGSDGSTGGVDSAGHGGAAGRDSGGGQDGGGAGGDDGGAGLGGGGEAGDGGLPAVPSTIAEYVQAQLEELGEGAVLPNASTDTVRTLRGLKANVVIRWLDPMTYDDATDAPRLGANGDFLAFFGDGWQGSPIYRGSSSAGYIWSNFEYVSGEAPDLAVAPADQHLTLARFLRDRGVLAFDPLEAAAWRQPEVDLAVEWHKKQMGGGFLRIVQDPSTGEWAADLSGLENRRFDSSSATLLGMSGVTVTHPALDDAGNPLLPGVVPGILGSCSGAQTPWGTILTAEESVGSYYGDLEPWWSDDQKLLLGQGADPGASITMDTTPVTSGSLGRSSNPHARKPRDYYGFVAEIDPTAAPDEFYGKTENGVGHRKLGRVGRARWQNVAIPVNTRFELLDDEPIVLYGGNDRPGGRIYKFVTRNSFRDDMTRAQTRALLASGDLYVAHFTDLHNAGSGLTLGNGTLPTEDAPGNGEWIHLSLTNTRQDAPNAAALGPGTKVGEALASNTWNSMGGFADQNDVLLALFTASMKIGIRELNRPEDIEWNPFDRNLYVAFTGHGRQLALDAGGVLYDPDTHATQSPIRADPFGAIFVLVEEDQERPAVSTRFKFYPAWNGSGGNGPLHAANPDNIMIDPVGNVWFSTDGNFATNGTADAIYYLDRATRHAIRVIAAPSNAEATGPAMTPDGRTLFFNVQHPGEGVFSAWPNNPLFGPRSALVAVTLVP